MFEADFIKSAAGFSDIIFQINHREIPGFSHLPMGNQHFSRPSIITERVEHRIQTKCQCLFRAPIDTKKIIFFALETDTLMITRPNRLCIILISGMHAIRAQLSTKAAGYALRASFDGVLADGISESRFLLNRLRKFTFLCLTVHACPLSNIPPLFFLRKGVRNFPSPDPQTTWNGLPRLEVSWLHVSPWRPSPRGAGCATHRSG